MDDDCVTPGCQEEGKYHCDSCNALVCVDCAHCWSHPGEDVEAYGPTTVSCEDEKACAERSAKK